MAAATKGGTKSRLEQLESKLNAFEAYVRNPPEGGTVSPVIEARVFCKRLEGVERTTKSIEEWLSSPVGEGAGDPNDCLVELVGKVKTLESQVEKLQDKNLAYEAWIEELEADPERLVSTTSSKVGTLEYQLKELAAQVGVLQLAVANNSGGGPRRMKIPEPQALSLIHISEPTRRS